LYASFVFVSCASLFWYWTFNVRLYRTSLFLDCKGRLVGVRLDSQYTLAPRNFPPSPPQDAAYWPDTQRTRPAKEETNGIWPAISQFFEESWVLLHAPKLGHGTDYFTSPPNEGFGRERTRYLGFEPTITSGERPQTYALDRAAIGTGIKLINYSSLLKF
jgi:hypothetical protein